MVLSFAGSNHNVLLSGTSSCPNPQQIHFVIIIDCFEFVFLLQADSGSGTGMASSQDLLRIMAFKINEKPEW
jgi:hypothetical protein